MSYNEALQNHSNEQQNGNPVYNSWGELGDSGVLCQKQVSRAGTSNYIPGILWDVITCPCPWYLLLAEYSSIDNDG